MATVNPPKKVTYPQAEIARLFAPPEDEHPSDKLRRLLREAHASRGYLHTAGAYDAFTAAIMTRLGFKALYGSGWQLAATKSMFPDIGVYASHDMVKLVHELWMGIEGARHTNFYDSGGKDVLQVPPMFVDMEAGFGGPGQTFSLAVELIRARAGGVHLENQDPADRTCGHIVKVGAQKRAKVLVPRKAWIAKLKAIKAAAQATGIDVVIIARTDSVDGAIPGESAGGVQGAIEDAWEAAELGRGRGLAGVQQHRDRPASGVRRGRAQVLSGADAGLQPFAIPLLREGQEGRHPDHEPAARRPGLHAAVLDALQLPDGGNGAGAGAHEVPGQRHRGTGRPAE